MIEKVGGVSMDGTSIGNVGASGSNQAPNIDQYRSLIPRNGRLTPFQDLLCQPS